MIANLTQSLFREIRQAYHSAVCEWSFDNKKETVNFLKQAIELTKKLIDSFEKEN